MRKKVKLLGERNSGTNFFNAVLEDGFDIEMYPNGKPASPLQRFILTRAVIPKTIRDKMREKIGENNHFSQLARNGGWKHSAITSRFINDFARPNDCHIVCIIRHPLAWARSMHRNPFHTLVDTPSDFSEFISTPWITRPRDELGETKLVSPLQLWQKKVQSYLDFSEMYPKIHLVKYEDVLFDTNAVHKRLSGVFTAKTDRLKLPQNNSRWFDKDDKKLDEYLKASSSISFGTLTKEELAPFIKHIGYGLIKELGYDQGLPQPIM